jgi:sulfite exporter TauE/SafE
MWEIITAGFLFGSVASLHCVAMCGPIALMLPHPSTEPLAIAADNLAYNIGRAVTYMAFGLIAGYFGSMIGLDRLQSGVSIGIGAAMIIGYIIYRYLPTGKLPLSGIAGGFAAAIKKPFGELLKKRSRSSLFALGLLNGLLPCGMVYTAVSMSMALASPIESMTFMGLYGLGTFPAMTALYLMPKTFRGKIKGLAVKALPAMVVLVGLFMVWRGVYAVPDTAAEQDTEICNY